MRKILDLLFLAAIARAVTFRVVAPGATDVQVSVNGQLTKLTATDPNVPYFTGDANASPGSKYKYVAGGNAEPFDRTLEDGRDKTRNDFFNRSVTYANIPKLPFPITENNWSRSGKEAPMFDSNYIPTIFITGNPADMENLIKTVPATLYNDTKFTFIGPEEVLVYENCSFGIHGAGKKRNNNKQSWRWMLPKGQNIYNRNYIKLRHGEEDPTQMREKLYSDILQAMGVYVGDANIVRFYINGQGMGTFAMIDDVQQYSYINAVFYDGKPPQQMGPLFDGASGADFQLSTDQYSSWIPNPASPEDSNALAPISQQINSTDYKDDNQVANLSKAIDVDHFMRFMVMEFLTGHWDGYWMEQTNDGAYRDPTDNNKWYYLGQDFDATFGVNLPQDRTFVATSYMNYTQLFPGGVLINNLLQNTQMRTRFETYLKNTTAILFNNYTLTNRVLEYQKFLLPDLEWDRSIEQQSPGINFGWTFPQVTQNLWQGVQATASNASGGAEWGLLEWVVAKSQAVAQELNVQIVQHPVGPPEDAKNASSPPPSPGTSPNVSDSAAAASTFMNSCVGFLIVSISTVWMLIT
ncbi:hypothetical protein LRAMOSA02621 [Lichtheimia ramosa]|uniref:Coth protein-domain-containing protein n=1 Tax=Lichtheimia ramosa TaxID=688394 RepID=A0A077WRU5_9FUNG|nr:hypothetical protein LRAMOSA02621 [Lichtheimia ramosa]